MHQAAHYSFFSVITSSYRNKVHPHDAPDLIALIIALRIG